ncbi:MAG: hypothetical protein PHT12_02885 [Patescibacteria group bacterium]|nr:hypothetical protein [Patescibacteria group bacterium]
MFTSLRNRSVEPWPSESNIRPLSWLMGAAKIIGILFVATVAVMIFVIVSGIWSSVSSDLQSKAAVTKARRQMQQAGYEFASGRVFVYPPCQSHPQSYRVVSEGAVTECDCLTAELSDDTKPCACWERVIK